MNVLFVDDQKSVLDGIASGIHFDDLGITHVRYATGATMAMNIMHEEPIDILFCDIEMPGEDGLSLITRASKEFPDMLTILLTSHAEFEYAQVSVRLGCFDYIVQPAPYDVIENVLKRALEHCYKRNKHNQLYEIGKRMQTGRTELLDTVAMRLFASEQKDVLSSLEILNLAGYSVSPEKKVLPLIISFDLFRKVEQTLSFKKQLYQSMADALKQAEFTYPFTSLSTEDRHREFILLLFSNLQEEFSVEEFRLQQFFDALCQELPEDAIQCYIGQPVRFDALRAEYYHIRSRVKGNQQQDDILVFSYDPKKTPLGSAEFIIGNGTRWRRLLEAGQFRVLQKEFDDCLDHIIHTSPNLSTSLCDLHQRLTYIFFNYFHDHNADVHTLFQDHYTYFDYMNSYSDVSTLKEAMYFMMNKVKEYKTGEAPDNDIEKAKNYIVENIADPITVKDVADHVGLSAEYFTKLFKKSTGKNIKEYITELKVETAKDMLEHSQIPVGMVALELGYSNFSHFSQIFKKYEDLSPSEYRAKVLGQNEVTI